MCIRDRGVNGWFSTNILGNRDGEVLDDPDNFKTKEVSKLSVIDTIFEPEKMCIRDRFWTGERDAERYG